MCIPVLVLAAAIVRMEFEVAFSECVGLQEVVEKTDDGVSPLPGLRSLVNEVINLR